MILEKPLRVGLVAFLVALTACSGDGGPSDPFQSAGNAGQQCLDDMLVPGGEARADIAALVNPQLIGGLDPAAQYLEATDRVIGFETNGEFVAVPYNILWWHEIVNLEVAGVPLAVTYSPLSGSSMVFDRRSVGGAEIGVSDNVLQNSLVMVDTNRNGQAGSLWPQMAPAALCGTPGSAPTLAPYPAIDIEWAGWLALHPDTRVVSSQTGRSYDYTTYPYGDYAGVHNFLTYFPQGEFDARRPPKDRVIGLPYPGGGGIAFPFKSLQGLGTREIFQWEAEGRPVVLFWDAELKAAVVYESTVNGQPLSFFRLNRFVDGRFFDEDTGSEWSFEGAAIAGPLEGMRLRQVAEAYVSFWFAWATFVPDSFLVEPDSRINEGNNAGKNVPDRENESVPAPRPLSSGTWDGGAPSR